MDDFHVTFCKLLYECVIGSWKYINNSVNIPEKNDGRYEFDIFQHPDHYYKVLAFESFNIL